MCTQFLAAALLSVSIGAAPAEELPPVVEAKPPAPAPYALPFQLRPTPAATVVRFDNVFVVRSAAGGDAMTLGSMFLFSYRISKRVPVAPFVRIGLFNHDVSGRSGTALTNPALGASWALEPLRGLRANLFLALALPLGTGGGNTPDPKVAAAAAAGVLARSGMDNAMFAINDLTVFPGVGLSYSAAGFTAQVEATVLQLTRVRGDKVAPDASRTNFTSGVHLGYFVQPWLSLGAELRYQRFLSTPVAVTRDPAVRDNLTLAFGPRFHLKGESFWARPGFSLTVPLDDPMARQRMVVLQLDVPVIFL